jgi:hypothetical protein
MGPIARLYAWRVGGRVELHARGFDCTYYPFELILAAVGTVWWAFTGAFSRSWLDYTRTRIKSDTTSCTQPHNVVRNIQEASGPA